MIEGDFGIKLVSDDGATSTIIPARNADLSSLDIKKDKNNNDFLSGTITLSGNDFDLVLHERITRNKTQLEVVYGDYWGLMKTTGVYFYDTRVCKLEVGDPEEFDSIINLEFNPVNTRLDFQYDSYIYNVWGIGSYQQYYDDFVTCSVNPNPPDWEAGKIYNGYTDYGGGSIAGDSDVAVYHNSKKWLSITPGNDSEPGVNEGTFRWLETPSLSTIGQERSKYNFDEDAKYNKLLKYWYKGGCSISTYTAEILGVNIKRELQTQLQEYGYDLATDWLTYPKSINPRYEDKLWIVSTEIKTVCTAFELIEIIQQLFNCEYVVKDNQLKFVWQGDRNNNWNNYLLREHDLRGIGIYEWANSEDRNVKRHVLKFTESDLETHDNSTIEYDNNYTEEAAVQGAFDVDLVYSFNKGDTPCIVTTDDDDEIDEPNTALIPSFLHETFYFVDREFKEGIFNGNSVTLQLGFFEDASIELDGSYDLNSFDLEYQFKIDELTTPDQYGICEEVKYNINDNVYTLKLKTRN